MIQCLILGFFLGALVMFISIGLMYYCKEKKSYNNGYFYVARDKDEELWLYLGEPVRDDTCFVPNKHGYCISINSLLKYLDYKDLKWEDEPIEIHLNLKN